MGNSVTLSWRGRLFGGAFFAAALSFGAASSALAGDRQASVDPSTPHMVVYPLESQRRGEEGTVIVSVHVSASGHVTGAKLDQSSGHDDLDTAGVQTALNWKYLPAMHGGATADDWANVQIVYKLPPEGASH